MNWFELGYTVTILVVIALIFYFLVRQRRRDTERRKDTKEGRAKRRFWRDMP